MPRLLPAVLGLSAAAHAAGYTLTSIGFDSLGEAWAVLLLALVAAGACFAVAYRFRDRRWVWPGMGAGLVAAYVALGMVLLGAPTRRIVEMGVYEGRRIALDTVEPIAPGRYPYRARVDQAPGRIFLYELHLGRKDGPAELMYGFNIQERSGPVRYSTVVPEGRFVEAFYIHPNSGQAHPTRNFDFRIERRGEEYLVDGWLEGEIISGLYRPRRTERVFIAPPAAGPPP